MNNDHRPLSIDVEKVIASKNPKLAKRLPRWVINAIKRLIHQDEINRILDEAAGMDAVDFATYVVEKGLGVTYNVHCDSLPDPSGRYVFASNHPLGGLDGMIMISYLGKKYNGNIKFVVNDLLLFIKPLVPVFVPVSKVGKKLQEKSGFNEAFSSDDQILYFPSGMCSRLVKGEITDLEWKKTFVTKAIESKRDIVPMYFSGRNSKRFYRIANIRKALGIKFNIEMCLLPDEMFRNRGTQFDIYIGEPIPYTSLTEEHTHAEWCRIIREKAYAASIRTSRQKDPSQGTE